jgi:hypothetical protein
MTTPTRTATGAQSESTGQLSLLTSSELPVQFRLDRRTRERGLANIAAIRRQLAQRGHMSFASATSGTAISVTGDGQHPNTAQAA